MLALSLLREQVAAPPQPSPLLCPQLMDMLTPILFRLPSADNPLELTLPKLMASFWPVWLTESANLVWFFISIDKTNASGFADQAKLTSLRNLWLSPVWTKAKLWLEESEDDAEVAGMLERLVDACARALSAIDATKAMT